MKITHKFKKNWMDIIVVFALSGINTAIATQCLNNLPQYYGDKSIASNGIAIKTCDHNAGAICSLTWGGKEFINDFDHGRQLQSASSFNFGGQPLGEAYNPTEAGSSHDGLIAYPGQQGYPNSNSSSSSCLLNIYTTNNNQVRTQSKMAFFRRDWLNGGAWLPAQSEHILDKKVTIGAYNFPNVIEYFTKFTVPTHEFFNNTYHRIEAGTFEVLTGYMPPEFNTFHYVDAQGNLQPVIESAQLGRPLIFSTLNGDWAMGIYSLELPQRGYPTDGYEATNFLAQNVVKWNTVFRKAMPMVYATPTDPSLIQNHAPFYFHSYVIVGTRDQVRATMIQLYFATLNQDTPVNW